MKKKKSLLDAQDLVRFQGLGKQQWRVMTFLGKHTKGTYSSDIRRELGIKANILSGSYAGLEARGLITREQSFPPILVYIKPTEIALKYFRGEW